MAFQDVIYNLINFKNAPDETTPVNASNLNKMDLGLKEAADRANASVPYDNIVGYEDASAYTEPNKYVADILAIKQLISNLLGKAPTQHDSSANTYGVGTSTKYGHTKGSDSVSSTNDANSGIHASPYAVKQAYDRADQAFQSASDGKVLIANAITGKGVPTSTTASFATMASNISRIQTDVATDIYSQKEVIGTVSGGNSSSALNTTYAITANVPAGQSIVVFNHAQSMNANGGIIELNMGSLFENVPTGCTLLWEAESNPASAEYGSKGGAWGRTRVYRCNVASATTITQNVQIFGYYNKKYIGTSVVSK